jgi:hypothetical protein
MALLAYSSMIWWIKILLSVILFAQCANALMIKKPYDTLIGLKYELGAWVLTSTVGQKTYQTLSILLHNEYFQLIELKNGC